MPDDKRIAKAVRQVQDLLWIGRALEEQMVATASACHSKGVGRTIFEEAPGAALCKGGFSEASYISKKRYINSCDAAFPTGTGNTASSTFRRAPLERRDA